MVSALAGTTTCARGVNGGLSFGGSENPPMHRWFVTMEYAILPGMKSLLKFFLWLGTAHATAFAANTAQWFAIRIADQPAGYQHVTVAPSDDGTILTTDDTVIVLNRMGSRIEVRTHTETREAASGELISVREESSSSAQTVVMEAHVAAGAIDVTTRSGENIYHRAVPVHKTVYGPAMLARESRANLHAPGDVVTCHMFLPSLGLYTLHRTLQNAAPREGQPVNQVVSTIDGVPGDIGEWLDADGMVLQLQRELPFGTMVASATDEASARQSAVGGELPAEAYAQTLARANIRLPDPRNLERVRLRITHRRPEYGWPAMRGPRQHVLEMSATMVLLDSGVTPPAGADPLAPERALGSNQILQADDAEVIRVTREVVADETDPDRIVRRLQEWVARSMTFDPGVAVTPASEVVRNRRGTCVAYAVLLASMTRAAGIPARVAMGCVYVAGAWGGHAWVDAWIGGEWRAIDAAAYRAGYADAARFQFDSYDFEDGGIAANFAGLQLYSHIDVTVVEYTAAGQNHVVAPDAKPVI